MRSSITSGNLALISLVLFVLACNGVRGQNGDKVVLMLDYEAGYGGAVYPVYNPYVFFADGTVAKEPKVAIEDMDRRSRSKDDAAKWGKWQASGGKVNIVWDGVNRKGNRKLKKPNGLEVRHTPRVETRSWTARGLRSAEVETSRSAAQWVS